MSKKKLDNNSIVNQEIKGKFVAREVKTCFSYEMEAILNVGQNLEQTGSNKELPDYEDIVNFYLPKCQNCGYQGEFKKVGFEDNYIYTCPDCKKETSEEPETEPQEIFEWWIVTEWLAKKLQDKGEAILDWGNNFYWGRTCTGQAILLDGVISEICEEMEILEGQKYDWSK
jgi:predicted Zn-ribbon and HTH transcriptional regulator